MRVRGDVSELAALFRPTQIGPVTLPNRFVRAGTAEGMVDGSNHATADVARLLGDLARHGVSLVITGHMYVQKRGQYAADQVAIDNDGAIAPLRVVAAAVHRYGGKIFAQLSHAGSQALVAGSRPVAPSAVPNTMTGRPVATAATEDEIGEVIEAFGLAARRAVAAGFDGIHLHGANGYLISQFSSPVTNQREDAWGGSAGRRDRFLLEVTRRVRAELSAAHGLSVKLGFIDKVDGGLGLDESLPRAARLAAVGAQAVEVSCNLMTSYADNIVPYVGVAGWLAISDLLPHRLFRRAPAEAYYRWVCREARQVTSLPLMVAGGVRSITTMAEVVASGDADFVALARPFIRQPDLVRRIEDGSVARVACTSCNLCIMHSGHHPLRCWREPRSALLRHAAFRLAGGFRSGAGSGQRPRAREAVAAPPGSNRY